jgi:hypothetical protein
MSIQHYYDINNAKIMVCGHSKVEGDSLYMARDKNFVALLESTLGKGLVINFGLGGDSVYGLSVKMPFYTKLCPNVEYALLCIGSIGNDSSFTPEQQIQYLQVCINTCIKNGIKPVLFTISPKTDNVGTVVEPVNSWVRQSGYPYIDMQQVALSVNPTEETPTLEDVKTNLFIDTAHFNVAGNLCLYNRVLMDCPFLV